MTASRRDQKLLVRRLIDLNTLPVAGWRPITVANPDGVSNETRSFRFGDQATIDSIGRLSLVGRDPDGNALMRYETPLSCTGNQAPSGTLFFLTREEFETRS